MPVGGKELMLQLIVLNVAIVSTLSCLWLWSVRTEVVLLKTKGGSQFLVYAGETAAPLLLRSYVCSLTLPILLVNFFSSL